VKDLPMGRKKKQREEETIVVGEVDPIAVFIDECIDESHAEVEPAKPETVVSEYEKVDNEACLPQNGMNSHPKFAKFKT
jgi:hypothetical protein